MRVLKKVWTIAGAAALTVVLAAIMAVPAQAADRHVKVINETGTAVHHFYGSNVGSNDWEEDVLGENVLEPGESIDINFNDGSGYCKFDFKVVFKDETEIIKKNIDVCKVGVYRLTE